MVPNASIAFAAVTFAGELQGGGKLRGDRLGCRSSDAGGIGSASSSTPGSPETTPAGHSRGPSGGALIDGPPCQQRRTWWPLTKLALCFALAGLIPTATAQTAPAPETWTPIGRIAHTITGRVTFTPTEIIF